MLILVKVIELCLYGALQKFSIVRYIFKNIFKLVFNSNSFLWERLTNFRNQICQISMLRYFCIKHLLMVDPFTKHLRLLVIKSVELNIFYEVKNYFKHFLSITWESQIWNQAAKKTTNNEPENLNRNIRKPCREFWLVIQWSEATMAPDGPWHTGPA